MAKLEAQTAHGPASNPLQKPLDRPADGLADMPEHYQSCSRDTLWMLSDFGFSDAELSSECIKVLETESHQWILRDAYLFTAVVYLWRAGEKGDLIDDLEKALWYLHRGFSEAASYDCDAKQPIARQWYKGELGEYGSEPAGMAEMISSRTSPIRHRLLDIRSLIEHVQSKIEQAEE